MPRWRILMVAIASACLAYWADSLMAEPGRTQADGNHRIAGRLDPAVNNGGERIAFPDAEVTLWASSHRPRLCAPPVSQRSASAGFRKEF
jgi:hypothetical protein